MRYVLRNGELVPKHLAPPKNPAQEAVYVISDVMEPTRHMGTGKVYDSKARFRAETRALGLVEVGTDPRAAQPGRRYEVTQADVVPDVKRAIEQLRSR